MIVSTRSILALGLGAVGAWFLAGAATAQQDGRVQKATNQNAPASASPRTPSPATIGTIDLREIMKKYDKVQVLGEEFSAAMLTEKNGMMKMMQEAQTTQETLAKLTPGSVDAKKQEDHLTQLKLKVEAKRESLQRDFALREAELYATVYKEIQDMVARVAKHRGLSFVVRVANDPIAANNPNSVLAAMEKTVVFSDQGSDITRDVIHNLNLAYKAAGGVPPKGNAGAAAPGAGRAPSGN